MQIIIQPISKITPDEERQLDEVGRLTFGADHTEPDTVLTEMQWGPVEWLVMGLVDGAIVSNVCLLVREISVGNQPLRVGGVGGVMTHPAHQRKGYAGQLLERGHAFLRVELKVDYAHLVCAEERVAYYSKFGYRRMTAPMLVAYKGGKVYFPGPVMVACLSGAPWPEGPVDLLGNPW